MRHRHLKTVKMEGFPKLSSEVSAQPKRTFHFTIYNETFGKSKMADVDMFGS